MPHPAHFICGQDCQFIMATYIGKYIVSTVGEYWPDQEIRRIHAKVFDLEWYKKNKNLKGDTFDFAYMKKFGFKEIGAYRKYETMVFKAKKMKKNDCKACLYEIIVAKEVECESYNDAKDAYEGHLRLCNKWSKE